MLRSYTRHLLPLMTLALFAGTATADYPLKPVPFNKVEMISDFWRPRLETQLEKLEADIQAEKREHAAKTATCKGQMTNPSWREATKKEASVNPSAQSKPKILPWRQ